MSTDEALELGRVKNCLEHLLVNHSLKSFLEGFELSFTLRLKLVVDVKLYELFSVVARDVDVLAAGVQFDLFNHSELLNVYGERSAEEFFEGGFVMLVVIQNVFQAFRAFLLPLRVVLEARLHVKQELVARVDHGHIDEHVIIDGETHEGPHQFEV